MIQKIKKALTVMCVIYTAIITVMYVIGWAVSDAASLFVPTPSKALLILMFSAVLGFASLFLSRDGTTAGKLVLHFAVCTAAFVVAFIIGGGFPVTGATSIVAVLMFIAVYAVVMAIRAIFCRRYRRAAVEAETYTSVFK